jgi:hypothetical protein
MHNTVVFPKDSLPVNPTKADVIAAWRAGEYAASIALNVVGDKYSLTVYGPTNRTRTARALTDAGLTAPLDLEDGDGRPMVRLDVGARQIYALLAEAFRRAAMVQAGETKDVTFERMTGSNPFTGAKTVEAARVEEKFSEQRGPRRVSGAEVSSRVADPDTRAKVELRKRIAMLEKLKACLA